MTDSATIQNIVQTGTGIVSTAIPAQWQQLTPLLVALATAITGAIIRAVERGNLVKQHQREVLLIKQAQQAQNKP